MANATRTRLCPGVRRGAAQGDGANPVSLQQSCAGAVGCLLSIVQDTDAPASVRVSASRSILEYSFKATEQMDMEARLQSIEEALAAPEGKAR